MSSNEIDPIEEAGAERHHHPDELGAGLRHVRQQCADEERRCSDRTPEERFEHGVPYAVGTRRVQARQCVRLVSMRDHLSAGVSVLAFPSP